MFWIRLSGWVFVALLVVTAVVMGVGSRLPEAHMSRVSGVVQASPARVWTLLAGVEREPAWRSGVKAAERLPDHDGQMCWRELQGRITVPLCAVESQPPHRLVVRVVDPRLPFGGEWTYTLEPIASGQTRLSILEERTTGPAMWRFAERYLWGEDQPAQEVLADVQQAFIGRPNGPG